MLFGLLVISGALPQVIVLVAGIPFNATLWFFGANELMGHLPIYGAMLVLLVYGSDPAAAAGRVGAVASLCPERVGEALQVVEAVDGGGRADRLDRGHHLAGADAAVVAQAVGALA